MTPAAPAPRRATLTRELLLWTLGALVLVWAGFIAIGYATGQHEADELTDGHLASTTALLLAYGDGQFRPAEPAVREGALRAHDYQQSLSVVLWDANGRLLTRTGSAPLPPFGSQEGFTTLQLGQPPAAWRAFSRWDGGRQRKLMVLLSLQERDELADDIAGQVSEPGLWLLPVVALVLGLTIRRGLRPLRALAREVEALDIHRPHGLAMQPRHEELAATADAIRTLVERYHAALSRERALAGEFAHELRTPLAALALQARALRERTAPPEAGELAAIESEALRAGEVLTHLLALARASRAELDEAAVPLDVVEAAAGVVAEFGPMAHAVGRELGLQAEGTFRVTGHPVLLQLALRNLVENALHHTPPGTQVEVQVDAAGRWVQVRDEAPAPAANRPAPAPAIGLGLGLGHRVVEKIAAIHGARFERLPVERGTCFRITFAAG